jgi:hypothetical protein
MQITFLDVLPTIIIGILVMCYGAVLWNGHGKKSEQYFGLTLAVAGAVLFMCSMYLFDPSLFQNFNN